MPDSPETAKARERMVREQIEARGIARPQVLAAMRSVPRHLFVPKDLFDSAYNDHPLPIGEGQTISQPYIVALMTEAIQLKPSDCVLEIGTGSGYQAAILSGLVAQVYTIEIKQKLYLNASNILKKLNYNNIRCRHDDGYFGWPEAAPFDAIMITAAVDHIPPPLVKQLRDGGRLVLPLGSPLSYQNLVLVTKQAEDVSVKQITGVLFVPMTGHAMQKGHP
jgi:protein-L-isoaspartate(D-aspartate) O-methyltransferase